MIAETKEVDLSGAQIRDVEIKRPNKEGSTLKFSVEGEVRGIETELIEQALLCNRLEPVSITVKMEQMASD